MFVERNAKVDSLKAVFNSDDYEIIKNMNKVNYNMRISIGSLK